LAHYGVVIDRRLLVWKSHFYLFLDDWDKCLTGDASRS
jgi:hypothetical protein